MGVGAMRWDAAGRACYANIGSAAGLARAGTCRGILQNGLRIRGDGRLGGRALAQTLGADGQANVPVQRRYCSCYGCGKVRTELLLRARNSGGARR